MNKQSGLPLGSVIGILGGGQLGRMLSLSASQLGFKTHIYDPDFNAPAKQVTNLSSTFKYDDINNLKNFAKNVDVITYEFENIPLDTIRVCQKIKNVYPNSRSLEICQDRTNEKKFLNNMGIKTVKFVVASSYENIIDGIKQLGLPVVIKTSRFGYDGKGQIRTKTGDDPEILWKEINTDIAILEYLVDFKSEISFLLARNIDGETIIFPPTINYHDRGILVHSTAPAILPSNVIKAGNDYIKTMADHLEVVGLLAMELFLTQENTLIFNEIAPRPHNSFHWTIEGCKTSQFQQLIRSLSGLPFGDISVIGRWHMRNILGHSSKEELKRGYKSAGKYVHEYGKQKTKENRKMGHITWNE